MIHLNLAITGLIFSIIFTSAEIALLCANSLQISVWNKQKNTFSKFGLYILNNKEEFLTVILIGTNLANILATSFASVYLINHGSISKEIIVFIIASVILIFGEVIPKTIFRKYANITLLLLSPILIFSRLIFYPIVSLLKLTNFIKVAHRSQSDDLIDKRDDLQHVYEQVDDDKTMDKDQQEMISNVFEISESTVYEAMTPRTEISSVSINDSLEQVSHAFIDSGPSKLLVHKDNLDSIVGVVYLYDLFDLPTSLDDVIKPIIYMPYSKLLMDAMHEFQSSHHSIAVILDEHGGTAGIITAEDVFEELLGDFEDEFDENKTDSKTLEDGSIITNAKMDWQTFNLKYGKLIPDGDYETIGGYIINAIGRIPNQGENLFLPIGQILIRKSSARNILEIQLFPNKE